MRRFVPITIAPHLDILYRHRISAICVLVLGISATLCTMIIRPNIYRSVAVVVVEPPQVAPGYTDVGNNNSTPQAQPSGVGDRLEALAHKAFSEERLSQLIRKFNLYNVRPGASMATAIDYMRRHIRLVVPENAIRYEVAPSQAAAPDVLNISFEYGDRVVAQRVTAELASSYIDEAYRERGKQADDTLRFLAAEVVKTRARVDAKSNQIKEIERLYQGSLPQELEANLAELARLQDRLSTIDQQLTTERLLMMGRGPAAPRSPQQELTTLELNLIKLRSQYSDQYPDVVHLKEQIADLKQRIGREDGADKPGRASAGGRGADSLDGMGAGLPPGGDRLEREAGAIASQIAAIKTRIAMTPVHGQELAAVTRDYDALDTEYHALLRKQATAQLSESIGKRHEDERLSLLEPANLPRKPQIPDHITIGIIGISFSLLAALALPFGLYFTDTSFKYPDEIQEEFEIPVVAAIPTVETPGQRWAAALPALLISSVGILAIAASFWAHASRVF